MSEEPADLPQIDLNDWVYLVTILGVIILALNFLFSPLLPADKDSNRYMLSALVQSEAAIIAVVISLSLVGVQIIASSYSSRAIDVFKESLPFKILFSIYLVAMVYGLGVLKMIKNDNTGSLEFHISFSYLLGVIAFLALIPYILNTLEIIKSHNIIDVLSKK